jgi:hypothetical protein
MFNLPPLNKPSSPADYEDLLARVRNDKNDSGSSGGKASGILAGYTYFGQFIGHDITFSSISDLTRRRNPESILNFRTARLDLDSLYGRGPIDSPYLYDPPGVGGPTGRLSVGWGAGRDEEDLPRTDGDPAIALIGDPRNDAHTIISQLHLAFIKLHNRLFDDNGDDFEVAQRLTCWHYQWVILHDYLFRVCDEAVLEKMWPESQRTKGTKPKLRPLPWGQEPIIPIEFAGAAFRFGHSMVQEAYRLNFSRPNPIPIFKRGSFGNLQGFDRLRPMWSVQWDHFLDFGKSSDPKLPQQSGCIDLSLSPSLANLPPQIVGRGNVDNKEDLRTLNIERGYQLGLPSGQSVARAIEYTGKDVLEELCPGGDPLWVYVLREASQQNAGKRLGKVGSTIVAETIIGLIAGDCLSYLNVQPEWTPTLPHEGKFELRDLIRAAGMPITKADLKDKRAFAGEYDPRMSLLDERRRARRAAQAALLKARKGKSGDKSLKIR